ncbi:MFS transporter [Streptomyces sp. L7]
MDGADQHHRRGLHVRARRLHRADRPAGHLPRCAPGPARPRQHRVSAVDDHGLPKLVQAVLVVTVGRLGDMYGRVRIYNSGFAVFTFASVLLSFDPFDGGHGAMWLIAWRVLQAVGGSMLTANSAAILTDAFPEEQRGFALGINQVAALGGMFIGLVAGGLLLGLGLAGGVLGERPCRRILHGVGLPHPPRDRRTRRRPYRTDGATSPRRGPQRHPDRDHHRPPALRRPTPWAGPIHWPDTLIAGGLLLLAAFVVIEKQRPRADDPARPVPPTGLHLGNLAGLAISIGRGGMQFVLDHLAAGHLAPAARLRLRRHTPVGRHLRAAAHRGLPRGRARPRPPLRPARLTRPGNRRRAALRRELPGPDVPADRLRILIFALLITVNRIASGMFASPGSLLDHGQCAREACAVSPPECAPPSRTPAPPSPSASSSPS